VTTKNHKNIYGCGMSLLRAYRRNGEVVEAEGFFALFCGKTDRK